MLKLRRSAIIGVGTLLFDSISTRFRYTKTAILLLGVLLLTFGIPSQTYGEDPEGAEIVVGSPPAISGGAEMARKAKKAPQLGPAHEGVSPYVPGLGTSIEGLDFDDNGAETGFVFIPPDTIGAAGPGHVVEVVNVMIEWHTKAGVLEFSDALADFFLPLAPLTFTFDPKVIYDQHAGRFLVVTLERTDTFFGDAADTSRILLAVSDDSDPNGTWYFHSIDASTMIGGIPHWADYPGFAVDEEAVYITANMFRFFSFGGFFGGSRLWVVDKGLVGGFYAGLPASVTKFDPYAATAGAGSIAITTQPAQVFGAAPAGVGTWLVSYSGLTDGLDEYVQSIRIDDPLGAAAFSHEFVNVGNLEAGGALPDAPQMGTAIGIETNDRRALNAVWRDNSLWLPAEILPTAGPDAGQVTAHWWELDTTVLGASTVADQGDVGGEDIAAGTHTFFPSIAVNANGDMAIGFSASAPTIFPGAYYTGRVAGDPAGTVQPSGVLRTGLDFYVRTFGTPGVDRNRWGDYSGTVVDPIDDLTFWVCNEYAITQGTPTPEVGRWGTACGSFEFPPIIASVDHFLGYRIRTRPFTPLTVTLADQFEEGLFDVVKPIMLYNPADKNGEGILDRETHLKGYRIAPSAGEPPHRRIRGITVLNQFGILVVDTRRAIGLLVPTAKSLVSEPPPPDPAAHKVDHYKCYSVRITPGTPPFPPGVQVFVVDQFDQPKLYDVVRQISLCNPVDKNGEGIKNLEAHLMCYVVAPAVGEPPHVRVKGFTNNQFGPERFLTVAERELCVPSEKALPVPSDGDQSMPDPS